MVKFKTNMQLNNTNDIIRALRRHELTLAKMYQQFAEVHPDYRQFWCQLAREEAKHARWIDTLGRYNRNGQIDLSGLKLNPQAIRTSISYLEKQIEESKNGKISLQNAVSVALDVEKSMIDKKFFEIFDMTDAKLGRIRTGLKKETDKHRQNLADLFEQLNPIP